MEHLRIALFSVSIGTLIISLVYIIKEIVRRHKDKNNPDSMEASRPMIAAILAWVVAVFIFVPTTTSVFLSGVKQSTLAYLPSIGMAIVSFLVATRRVRIVKSTGIVQIYRWRYRKIDVKSITRVRHGYFVTAVYSQSRLLFCFDTQGTEYPEDFFTFIYVESKCSVERKGL